MSVLSTILLVVFLAVTAIGFFTWRSGGKGLVLVGALYVSMIGANWFASAGSSVSYALYAIAGVLLLLAFTTVSREVWRRMRLELVLFGATVVAILASASLTNLPAGVDWVLLMLVVVLAATSISVSVVRAIRHLRSVSASGVR